MEGKLQSSETQLPWATVNGLYYGTWWTSTDSLWPSDAIWHHKDLVISGSGDGLLSDSTKSLAELIISETLPKDNFTENVQDVYPWYEHDEFENY